MCVCVCVYVWKVKTLRTKTADSVQTAVLYKQSVFYAACSWFRSNWTGETPPQEIEFLKYAQIS